jgi:hypothetical protein
VNYGTREDFMKLAEMGVELKGKIAVAAMEAISVAIKQNTPSNTA